MKIARGLLRLLTAIGVGAVLQSVDAKTITVHTTANDGSGSLRQAIAQAVNGDNINIVVNGTITLTSGELLVNKTSRSRAPGRTAPLAPTTLAGFFTLRRGSLSHLIA